MTQRLLPYLLKSEALKVLEFSTQKSFYRFIVYDFVHVSFVTLLEIRTCCLKFEYTTDVTARTAILFHNFMLHSILWDSTSSSKCQDAAVRYS